MKSSHKQRTIPFNDDNLIILCNPTLKRCKVNPMEQDFSNSSFLLMVQGSIITYSYMNYELSCYIECERFFDTKK